MSRNFILTLAFLLFACPILAALPPEQAQQLFDRARPSLVAVQYTLEGEFGRRDLTGPGIVIAENGLVVTPLALFPIAIPDEQMKDFKIILPGDQETELPALFLGRDERSDLAFLKTKDPQKWPAISFQDTPVNIADEVISIGLLPKETGYKPYYASAIVSAQLRGPVPQTLVSPSGLTSVGSPVFNTQGKAIGLVHAQLKQPILLGGASEDAQGFSPLPPRFFVPARDFLPSLADPPTGKPLQIPWLGAQLTGPSKEVAEYFNLKNVPVALVGEVIPKTAAEKAGLKSGDKIVKLNGQPLERGDEPNDTPRIMIRAIRRMNVGDKITLTILRTKGQPTIDLTVTLEEQPRQANLAKRFYAEDLGLSVREALFADTYLKRLPQDTPGVVVAYIRPASAAATAALRAGDFVKELNSVAVQTLDQFKTQYQGFRKARPKEVVVLVVVREGTTQVIKIEPPQ